jgi:ketosteroid isomerase-like protein
VQADVAAEQAAVVERYLTLLFDATTRSAQLGDLLHEDVLFIEHPNLVSPQGSRRDRAALLESFEAGRRLMAEQRLEGVEILPAGDHVVARAAWSGTLAVDAPPLRAGSTLRARLAMFFTVRDGRVFRQENYDCYEPLPVEDVS